MLGSEMVMSCSTPAYRLASTRRTLPYLRIGDVLDDDTTHALVVDDIAPSPTATRATLLVPQSAVDAAVATAAARMTCPAGSTARAEYIHADSVYALRGSPGKPYTESPLPNTEQASLNVDASLLP